MNRQRRIRKRYALYWRNGTLWVSALWETTHEVHWRSWPLGQVLRHPLLAWRSLSRMPRFAISEIEA